MSNLRILLKNSFINNTGINSLTKGSHASKEKKKLMFATLTLILAGIIICGMTTLYSIAMAIEFGKMGYLDVILIIAVLFSCVLSFVTSIYKAQGALFSAKDYDLLMALPIKNSTILASKIISVMGLNYVGTACIILPASIVYFIFNGTMSAMYFIIMLIGFIFIPMIPVVVASIVAVVITFISSRFKHKNIATIIVGMVFFLAVMMLSMNAQNFGTAIEGNEEVIFNAISSAYIPALYFKEALVNSDLISLIKLILISIIPFVIFIFIFSKTFKAINSKLAESYKKSNYKVKELKANGQLKAILIQEFRRYIATPIYVMNTAIGVVLLLIAAISTLFIDKTMLLEIIGYPGVGDMIPMVVLVILIFTIGVSCTSNSSISLEGNRLWIIKSLPIDIKDIFKGKILMNLVITIPAVIIANIIFFIGLKFKLEYFIFNLVISIIFAILSAVIGLIINLYFPKLDWTNPTTVVKQSASVFISLVITMIIVALAVGAFVVLKISNNILFLTIISVVLLIILIVAWKVLSKNGEVKFKEL